MRGALAGACLSQMYVPCAMGDPRCRHLLRIIEAISRADQSIDWCTIIATDAPNSMGCLDSHGAPYGSRTRLFRLKIGNSLKNSNVLATLWGQTRP